MLRSSSVMVIVGGEGTPKLHLQLLSAGGGICVGMVGKSPVLPFGKLCVVATRRSGRWTNPVIALSRAKSVHRDALTQDPDRTSPKVPMTGGCLCGPGTLQGHEVATCLPFSHKSATVSLRVKRLLVTRSPPCNWQEMVLVRGYINPPLPSAVGAWRLLLLDGSCQLWRNCLPYSWLLLSFAISPTALCLTSRRQTLCTHSHPRIRISSLYARIKSSSHLQQHLMTSSRETL